MNPTIVLTSELPDNVSELFYICKDNDPSKVLFSTMAGNRFIEITNKDREWQDPWVFFSYEEATNKIKELYNEYPNISEPVMQHNLQVLKITSKTTVRHDFFKPFLNAEEFENQKYSALMQSFESFYSNVTEHSSFVLRQKRKEIFGYTDSTINEAFNKYLEFVKTLP